MLVVRTVSKHLGKTAGSFRLFVLLYSISQSRLDLDFLSNLIKMLRLLLVLFLMDESTGILSMQVDVSGIPLILSPLLVEIIALITFRALGSHPNSNRSGSQGPVALVFGQRLTVHLDIHIL